MSVQQTREALNQQLGTALAKRALCDEEIAAVRASIQGFNVAITASEADAQANAEGAKAEEEPKLEE